MKMKFHLLLFITCCCSAFVAGNIIWLQYPEYFPAPEYDFNKNPLSKAKIELGRALFYDPVLSKDNTISCASCHSPYNAFAHTDHDLSHGIYDQIGTRNAPALFNLAWQKSFMWDGAINHLDMQALAPISHPGEMGENLENVVLKLQKKKVYPGLFFQAFQDSVVTGEHILKALSQFQLTLVSANSKYDDVKKGGAQFTEQEKKGYVLFQNKCNACHTEPLFSNYGFANNGLPVDTTLNDYGKWKITQQPSDSLLFKIPSLRNLSYTYPYMHDGRFKKLSQVLRHYTDGIAQNKTLADELKKGVPLTEVEQADLIAFLLTLNDKTFVFDPDFQFPKKIFFPTEGFKKKHCLIQKQKHPLT
ncbi:MAG: c-type cytochrome [Saprospiraceae bacterium]|nr:c-type cytochrome [Saprospiraceae bacterium]MCB9323843.1 c-type cytochrome [Lewinellaceae bacterium]